MALLGTAESAESSADKSLSQYEQGLSWYLRTGKPDGANVALCHAYMAALADRFNLALPVGVDTETALREVQQSFGATNSTTLLVEREFADSLRKRNQWARAIQLWLHANLTGARQS